MQEKDTLERTQMSQWSCGDVDKLYEKIAKVGSGTYGEVNKAKVRADPNKFVALKKIKDDTETEGFPITALREISLLQQCDHPNIIKLLDVVISNTPEPDSKRKKPSTYLVFEYMEHELLGLIETCQLTSPQVKCVMKQMLEGLSYLHSKNIIHRDIKSANILINNKGEVKIADFGLAKRVLPNFTGKLTQRVVTRWYRAPELLLGCKKYTSKIDMWALGCVFAELLLGRSHALFPAQKTPDQLQMICEKCGIPTEAEWPGHKNLPYYPNMMPKKKFTRQLRQYMKTQKKNIESTALDLLDRMLTFNPETRITADEALAHEYFTSEPLPCKISEMPKLDKDCHAYILNSQRKNNKQSMAQNVQKQNVNNQNPSNNCNPNVTNSNSKVNNVNQTNPNTYYPTNIVPPNINQNFIPPNLQTQYPIQNIQSVQNMQNGYFNGYYNGYPNPFQAQPTYQPYMQFNNFNIMGPIINNYQFNGFDNSFFYPGSNEYIQQNLSLNSFFRSDANLNQNLLPNFNPFIAPPMSMYGKANDQIIPSVENIYSEVYQNINNTIKIPNPNPTPVFHKRKTSHDIDHFFELTKKKPIVDPILPNN